MDAQKLRRGSYTPCPLQRHSKERPLHLRDHRLVEIGEGLASELIEESAEFLRAELFERGIGRRLVGRPGGSRAALHQAGIHHRQIGIGQPLLQVLGVGGDPIHVNSRPSQRTSQLVVRSIQSQKGTHAAHPARFPLGDASNLALTFSLP